MTTAVVKLAAIWGQGIMGNLGMVGEFRTLFRHAFIFFDEGY